MAIFSSPQRGDISVAQGETLGLYSNKKSSAVGTTQNYYTLPPKLQFRWADIIIVEETGISATDFCESGAWERVRIYSHAGATCATVEKIILIILIIIIIVQTNGKQFFN